tara:strand:- start:342 stop:527 length:186 start_codon:yes stop_codon:yes gene_type:complete
VRKSSLLIEKEKEMIIIIKILWILFAIVLKLATIGLGAYFLEKMFDALERIVDRRLGIVTV